MDQVPYNLDQTRRVAVLEAILEVCVSSVAGVCSRPMCAVVQAEVPPERVMNDFKAYASRRLNRMRLDETDRKRWARHGSTRFLWKAAHVLAAIQYVADEQDDAMSVFESSVL